MPQGGPMTFMGTEKKICNQVKMDPKFCDLNLRFACVVTARGK